MNISPESDLIARAIVDSAYRVHSQLGPGLLESVYELCLHHELTRRGLKAARQVSLPVRYADLVVEGAFRVDLMVEDLVIVEVKAAEHGNSLFEAQLLTYLRLADKRLGLLINFNVPRIKDGIRRMVL